MRHPTILDSEISTPQGLKDVLQDDLLRQYYFLTPDLKESEMMMAKKMTNIDIDGNIIQEENGGKRRIDFLLFSPQDNPVSVIIRILQMKDVGLILVQRRTRCTNVNQHCGDVSCLLGILTSDSDI